MFHLVPRAIPRRQGKRGPGNKVKEVLENDDVTIIINPNNQRPGGKSLVVKQAGPAFSNFSGIEWMENF